MVTVTMKKRLGTSTFQWRIFAACCLFTTFFVGYIFGLLSQSWINDKPVIYSSSNPLFISLGTPYDFIRTYNETGKLPQIPPVRNLNKISKFLAVGILTSPNNFMRRKYIRESWISLAVKGGLTDFHHVFVIGSETLTMKDRLDIENEVTEYRDLLLLDKVVDSYRNLTLKVMNYFKWLDQNVEFSYVLKVDDDSFASLGEIYSLLKKREKHQRLYMGYFDGRARVKHYGKWAEKSWVLCDRYLPYARGGGYILSHDLVSFIANNSRLLQLYNSEDVSVGTWLAPLKIDRVHNLDFDTEYESRGCLNNYLVTHKQTTQDMVRKYHSLVHKGKLCDPEVRLKSDYYYNWDVLPSLCCKRNSSKITVD